MNDLQRNFLGVDARLADLRQQLMVRTIIL